MKGDPASAFAGIANRNVPQVQGHVRSSIEAVLGVLNALCSEAHPPLDPSRYPSIEDARHRLRDFADETLGASHAENAIRILVTMPSEAATNPAIIDGLLEPVRRFLSVALCFYT